MEEAVRYGWRGRIKWELLERKREVAAWKKEKRKGNRVRKKHFPEFCCPEFFPLYLIIVPGSWNW